MLAEEVHSNFNKNGSTYKTSIGAFISLGFNALLIALVVLKGIKMHTHRDDAISYSEQPISKDEAGFMDL